MRYQSTRCQSGLVPAVFVLALMVQSIGFSQQVTTDPASTHIFPAGGRRGSRVDVRVGGECLPPSTRFRLWGDGVAAPPELGDSTSGQYAPSPRRKPGEQQVTYPREWQSQVEIAADASLGVKLWRLSCARGGTGARPFVVGDMPEFIETEPNSLPDEAQRVELPVTLNGQIAGESDLDYYRFDAKAGDVVGVDVVAARLGSALDPIVEVFGPDGRRVVADDVRAGADPVLAFRVPVSGEYRLLISNVTFRGGPSYVYRVTLSTAPLIRFAFPPGSHAGTTRDIDFFSLAGDGSLRTMRDRVSFPTATGEFRVNGPAGANTVPLIAGDLPEGLETESNNARESATELVWPLVMNGQLQATDDEDWFRVACRQSAPLSIECSVHPNWSSSLPIVSVTDANGGVLASASAVQSAPGSSLRLEWRPPADGTFWLRVRDLQQGIRGGPEFVYRLCVREAMPDFSLAMKADVVNVVQGGRAEVDLAIERRGGFVAPIELVVEGLPEGVRIDGHQIAVNQTSAKLAFVAEANARSGDVTLRIKGRAEIDGKLVERAAKATHLGHDVDGIGVGSTAVEHVQLTVVHKPVFKLYCNEAYQYAHRGTVYPYLMEVERLDGFDGPIRLQMADRQIKDLDGIEIVPTTVAPGQSQVMLPLNLPETMHINVQAHSNVYAQGHVEFLDKFGQKQTMLVVSTMRCMIRTLPTVAKLRVEARELNVSKEGVATATLVLDRTSHFSGPARIELVDADAGAGVTVEPNVIASDQTRADVIVHVRPSATTRLPRSLTFRAMGEMPDGVRVISEAKVILTFTE